MKNTREKARLEHCNERDTGRYTHTGSSPCDEEAMVVGTPTNNASSSGSVPRGVGIKAHFPEHETHDAAPRELGRFANQWDEHWARETRPSVKLVKLSASGLYARGVVYRV